MKKVIFLILFVFAAEAAISCVPPRDNTSKRIKKQNKKKKKKGDTTCPKIDC